MQKSFPTPFPTAKLPAWPAQVAEVRGYAQKTDPVSQPPNGSSAGPVKKGGRARWLSAIGIFLFFFCIGALVLVQCPPLWRDYDGLIEIATRPNDMTILQYPAAYPAFSRAHVYAAAIVRGWMHHQKVTIDIWKGVALNDGGVRALMISQELALALALTAFVLTFARTAGARIWTALFLASNASIFVTANLISTEALAEALIIAVVALGFRIFARDKPSVGWMTMYGLCLYVAIMTRHTNAIFAMLVPVAYFGRFVVEWVRTRRAVLAPWKGAVLFILVGLVCIGASKLTTRGLCQVFGVEYRSISARATSERLGFVKRMSEPEREAFLAGLVARANDPVVREAIPLLARPASWVQQREEIENILLRETPDMNEDALKVKADAYLEEVADLFYGTHNRYLVQETWESIWRTFAATSSADASAYYLKTGAWSVELYASHPQFNKKTHGLSVCSEEARQRIMTFESNPWLGLWRWLPLGMAFLAGSLLALIFLFRQTGDPSAPVFALATAITGIAATCLAFVLVNYNPRFTTVADLFGWMTLAIVLAHGIDSRGAPVEKAP
ncbi:MAG: hypothetical protein P4L99_03470 [Chthoniobacter sp.]|nr:hypothetical protein [Chthoniobacter sp.]